MPIISTSADVPVVSGARLAGRVTRVPEIRAPASGLVQVGEQAIVLSQRLGEAKKRLDNRRDVVERTRGRNSFRTNVGEELRRVMLEGDISSSEELDAFRDFVAGEKQTALASFPGGEEQRLGLTADLEDHSFTFLNQAAIANVTASREASRQLMGELFNEFAGQIRLDPGNLNAVIALADEEIAKSADLFDPGEEATARAGFRGMAMEAAIQPFLDAGDPDTAENILLETPGALAALGEVRQRRLFDQIAGLRRAQTEVARQPIKGIPRDVFNRLSPEQQVAVLGASPSAEKLVEIGDPSSPTGSRFVPESQAIGQPGRPRTPVVQVGGEQETAFAKELGKEEAKGVTEIRQRGTAAFRNLAEIERMSAAIESGRFRTGVLSDIRVFMARLTDFVGVPPDHFLYKLVGDAATADTLDAAANVLGVEAAQKLGRITNMSLTFIRDSLPSLTRTPEGNRILLEVMKRTEGREIEIASLVEQFIQQHGSLTPPNERTFYQAVRDLEEGDPIITPELRERIIEGSRTAPNSFNDVLRDVSGLLRGGEGVPTISSQEEFDALEPGAEFIWTPTGEKARKD
jgi:hypothetical protein